jgi:replicative DNA helicase
VQIPHDVINEQTLIAAAIVDAKARKKLTLKLKPDAFLVKEHAEIWIALSELARRDLEYDPATLRTIAGTRVDEEYIAQLLDGRRGTPANLDHHVSMLEWDRARVEAVRGPLSQLLESLKDPTTPPERVRAYAQAASSMFSQGASTSLLREPTGLVQSALAQLRSKRDQACYPFGIEGFDRHDDGRWRMVPGMAPGLITVLTGVPGSGKSTVTARIALAQIKAGRRVAYGAWEMGDEQTLMLLAAMDLGWGRTKLQTGDLTDDEEKVLGEKMEELATHVRFVMPPFSPRTMVSGGAGRERVTNDRVLDQLHAVLSDVGADVFIADLFKRLLRRIEPDEEEQALVRIQAIAADTRTHCLLLQQQRSKDVEARADKRPTREGIKGSGAWVEIADTIIGVHRQALFKNIDDVTIELDVLKQRWGAWPMAVEFGWDSEFGAISGGREVSINVSLDDEGVDGFLDAPVKKAKRMQKGRK